MYKYLLAFILLISSVAVFATHNIAGDITYKHISGLTYEITVTIFADGDQTAIGRREIEIDWGDNTKKDSLVLVEQQSVAGSSNILKRIWRERHTYPSSGSYTVRVVDPNRVAGVNNISNSVNQPFTIQTLIRILPFRNDANNSVQLLNNPIDDACVGQKFVYNPGAVDSDGDSIAYAISESKGIDGQNARGFVFPPNMTVNAITGDLIWDTPSEGGLFNVAILVKEYRNGVSMGEVLRDIQIKVVPGCDNQPPDIIAEELVCVEADSTVRVLINGTDPDPGDRVKLTVTGEFFTIGFPNPPIKNDFDQFDRPVSASLVWNTNCDNVRIQPYNASIKAEDDAVVQLTTFKTVGIRVVAPAPDSLEAIAKGRGIELSWINSRCPKAIGYNIYRRFDSSGFAPSNCEIGVPASTGYEQIASIIGLNNTTFIDDDNGNGLIPGRRYCYLVTSFFPDGDESYASVEVCAEVLKIVPVITNVSIDSTEDINGEVLLRWSKPDSIDAIEFPPPYKYYVYKDQVNDQSLLIDSTEAINDTFIVFDQLNTESSDHAYQVSLYSFGLGRKLVGRTPQAHSVFLSISPTDEMLQLSWTAEVPWSLDSFVVYRKIGEASTASFDSIATVKGFSYDDLNLINDTVYCYYISSYGSYRLRSVENPLINLSQEVCSTPIDNIAPCPPIVEVNGDCENDDITISWEDIQDDCAADISFHRLYRSKTVNGEMELFSNKLISTDTVVNNAGCYTVTAVDSVGNESDLISRQCIDFCPEYNLPNVFTPNGDGKNDFFIPIQPYQYVDSIFLVVYNRWGDEVFTTSDPEINWDGKYRNTNEMVSSGVYFYTCQVFEQSIEKSEPRLIKGTITILEPLNVNKPE